MGIGIREARSNLPSLIKRAASSGEDIRVGARGADEVTLVSTQKYRRLRRQLKRLRKEVAELRAVVKESTDGTAAVGTAQPEPFSGLQRALEEGQLRLGGGDEPRVRRLIPGYSPTSTVSRAERIRIGSRGSVEPEHRRDKPRA